MSFVPLTPSEEAYAAEADQGDVFTENEPIALFKAWFAAATETEPNDPNAMTLATIDADGAPDARIVLLKDADARGLTFYTNLESAKGRQLAGAPHAALVFHWKTLRRQVRFRGAVAPVDPGEADAYFASRARGSQIGAWASAQSRPMETDDALTDAVRDLEGRFSEGEIPRPPHWSGFRLAPLSAEFWVNRPYRLHDRLVFSRARADGEWTTRRLYP